MVDAFNGLLTILHEGNIINSENLVFFMMFLSGMYYFFKVHIPREDEKMRMFREDMLANRQVMNNFSQTLCSLDKKLDSFDATLDRISEKLAAHDENARGLGESVKSLASMVERMKEKTPTLGDLNKLENKVEDCRKENATSKDSEVIVRKLDDIMHAILELKNAITNK